MKTALVIAALSISAVAAAAEPIGTFKCEGRNPGVAGGPPSYKGTATITRDGDIYNVVWVVGAAKERIEGRGLLENGVLAVTAGPSLVVYTQKGNTWVGRWHMHGGKATGTETLTPQ